MWSLHVAKNQPLRQLLIESISISEQQILMVVHHVFLYYAIEMLCLMKAWAVLCNASLLNGMCYHGFTSLADAPHNGCFTMAAAKMMIDTQRDAQTAVWTIDGEGRGPVIRVRNCNEWVRW